MSVEALAVKTRLGPALDDILVACRPLEARGALALIAVLQGLASGTVFARATGAVVFQLAVASSVSRGTGTGVLVEALE